VSFGSKRYSQAPLVTLLAALEATYVVSSKRNASFAFKNHILATSSA
jgi:hypothetical protein